MSKQNKTFKDRRLEELVKLVLDYINEFTDFVIDKKNIRPEKLEQFLSETIDMAEKESKLEILDKVSKIIGSEETSIAGNEVDKIWEECVNAERFRIGHSIFLLKQSLSITNKEKQNE